MIGKFGISIDNKDCRQNTMKQLSQKS